MMNRLIIKPLFKETDTHLGALAKFGYVSLPQHDELYLVKEIKQKFKVLGIPFHVTTSLDTFQVPREIETLFISMLGAEDFSGFDLGAYRNLILDSSKSAVSLALKAIENSDMSEEEKVMYIQRVKDDVTRVEFMMSGLTTSEGERLNTFLKSGYTLLYKMGIGTTTTYYMARVMDDRIMLFAVDLLKFKRTPILTKVSSFYITKKFMEALLSALN